VSLLERMRAVACVSQIITLHQFREILYTVIRIFKIPGDTAAEQALSYPGYRMKQMWSLTGQLSHIILAGAVLVDEVARVIVVDEQGLSSSLSLQVAIFVDELSEAAIVIELAGGHHLAGDHHHRGGHQGHLC